MLSEDELKSIDELIMLKHFLETEEKYEGQEREVNAIKTVLNLITKLEKEIKELKKYDYRNIKIEEENKIKSPSFTKEQLDLMNLGIALYIGIPKILEDEDETDI